MAGDASEAAGAGARLEVGSGELSGVAGAGLGRTGRVAAGLMVFVVMWMEQVTVARRMVGG